MAKTTEIHAAFVTTDQMLSHWQGHRRLTRRVIDAFPEDQLFHFSIGGMRTFGELAMEIITMSTPMLRGIVSGDWTGDWDRAKRSKAEMLRLFDESTAQIGELWPQIPPDRFSEVVVAFGQYEDRVSGLITYVIDNEIHHR